MTVKNMKVLTYFILSLLFFSQASECLNVVKLDGHISLQKVKKDPLIQISITESLLDSSQENIQLNNFQFFVLKSVSRHKNKTYSKLIKNYQKLVSTLIQKLIIGDEKLLIKSKIKQKYLKKKKLWEFGIMFMMQGQAAEIQQCYHEIVKLGVIKMNAKPKTAALNQRIIASKAYYKLKQKLWSELNKMPKMIIRRVLKVQITGFSIPHSIKLQKKEFQQSFEDVIDDVCQDISLPSDYFFLKAEVPQQSKSVTIKAIFQVGQYQQDDESSSTSEESQFESDSYEQDSQSHKKPLEDQ